jgi:hypothetical protein
MPCSLVELYQLFRVTYCLHHRGTHIYSVIHNFITMYNNAVCSWNHAAASRAFGGKKLWYDLMQYSGVCPEGLSKSTHNVRLAGGCLD